MTHETVMFFMKQSGLTLFKVCTLTCVQSYSKKNRAKFAAEFCGKTEVNDGGLLFEILEVSVREYESR